ncbi:hypothetical protein HYPSUDRAFT_398114 [Hypholoma sublateritium FD-334 SS-4]|uniref:Uncharacterized protein n=1 Tax=Hypholoma sublateritium (strain FD-334 SS-4) TaxID=945553 RepID=A0A0D2LWB2_HYPSF|nr:hypothetical protein HYPSUDRAFT_398114 [Hypholoma sublateritium FD-334 SS-4]
MYIDRRACARGRAMFRVQGIRSAGSGAGAGAGHVASRTYFRRGARSALYARRAVGRCVHVLCGGAGGARRMGGRGKGRRSDEIKGEAWRTAGKAIAPIANRHPHRSSPHRRLQDQERDHPASPAIARRGLRHRHPVTVMSHNGAPRTRATRQGAVCAGRTGGAWGRAGEQRRLWVGAKGKRQPPSGVVPYQRGVRAAIATRRRGCTYARTCYSARSRLYRGKLQGARQPWTRAEGG